MYDEYSGRFVKGTDDVPPEKGLPLDMDPDVLVKALNAVLRRMKVAEAMRKPESKQPLPPKSPASCFPDRRWICRENYRNDRHLR